MGCGGGDVLNFLFNHQHVTFLVRIRTDHVHIGNIFDRRPREGVLGVRKDWVVRRIFGDFLDAR